MKYILDTGILVGVERENSGIISFIKGNIKDFDVLYITLLTYAEFYRGYAGKQPDIKSEGKNFLNTFRHLTVTEASAMLYAELSYKYVRQGITIEPFDLLIAAIAIENNIAVITTDTDFERIAEVDKVILKL